MESKIVWTNEAQLRLKDIYDFHFFQVNPKVAETIVFKIIDSVDILKRNPKAGAKEALLKHRKIKYFSLISSNYKIVYWLSGDVVYIATLFDTRQNPVKLKRVK